MTSVSLLPHGGVVVAVAAIRPLAIVPEHSRELLEVEHAIPVEVDFGNHLLELREVAVLLPHSAAQVGLKVLRGDPALVLEVELLEGLGHPLLVAAHLWGQ